MKKLIGFLIVILLAIVATAQDRVVKLDPLNADVTKSRSVTMFKAGVAADTLTANQDTIRYSILLNKSYPVEYYCKMSVDTLDGAVTTVTRNVYGRMFDSQAWVKLSTAAAAVNAAADIVLESMTTANYSETFGADSVTTITPTLTPYYRELMFELILTTAGSGTGINVKTLDLFISEAKQ